MEREKIVKFTFGMRGKFIVARVPCNLYRNKFNVKVHELRPTGKYRVGLYSNGEDYLHIQSVVVYKKRYTRRVTKEYSGPRRGILGILGLRENKTVNYERELEGTFTRLVWVPSERIKVTESFTPYCEEFTCGAN